MSSLYPSLEDMQVDKMAKAQHDAVLQQQHEQYNQQLPSSYPQLGGSGAANSADPSVYPELMDFMGLELSEEMIVANMPHYSKNNRQLANVSNSVTTIGGVGGIGMIAPLSGGSVGLQRAQVTHGIRELILCKGSDKKVGLRAKGIDKGVFVTVVVKESPAALAGLRFGDQILQINGTVVAGYSMDDIHSLLRKSPKNDISMIVRDRPFERTITLHKDSTGHCGFKFNGSGCITTIVKDSSAAKNGVLTDHYLLEINGQNVIGMKEKQMLEIIANGGQIITITIMPKYIYDHMMKKLSSSFIKNKMDHSIPDF